MPFARERGVGGGETLKQVRRCVTKNKSFPQVIQNAQERLKELRVEDILKML